MLTRSNQYAQLLFECPAYEPLRRAIFGTSSSIFDLWSSPRYRARFSGLREVSSRPYPRKVS